MAVLLAALAGVLVAVLVLMFLLVLVLVLVLVVVLGAVVEVGVGGWLGGWVGGWSRWLWSGAGVVAWGFGCSCSWCAMAGGFAADPQLPRSPSCRGAPAAAASSSTPRVDNELSMQVSPQWIDTFGSKHVWT